MKTTSALATIALAAVAVSATPSPAQVEARATSSGTSSGSLPTITTRGNGKRVTMTGGKWHRLITD